MGRITASTGLISGLPIQQTVDQLIALQARPRDLLTARNKTIEQRQLGLTSVTASLLKLQLAFSSLKRDGIFAQRTVTSSKTDVLSATITGTASTGSYQFRSVRLVQSQQFVSTAVASDQAALGAGTVGFRFGGFVDPNTRLDLLNGGEGVARGQIRVTDRSGASAVIDLRLATSVKDVLAAVNGATGIRVRAEVDGNGFRLVDLTGQTTANLRVDEVSGGSTAASLGLDRIDAAASSASGREVLRLFNNLGLDQLNDGLGVRLDGSLDDLKISFRDNTEITIDFLKAAVAGTKPFGTTTAKGGPNSQLTFTAVEAGSKYAGVSVAFQDDSTVTAGSETVSYDEDDRVLLIKIDAGNTTASQVVAALARDEEVKKLFTASLPSGVDGSGVVDVSDLATIEGRQSTAALVGTLGAKLNFTAVRFGAAFDGVKIRFENNAAVIQGAETVAYNASNKELVFQIAAGSTTAGDIAAAVSRDTAVSGLFTANLTSGSLDTALVDIADTATTAGGALIEPVPAGKEETLGGLLTTLNAVAPTKLRAQLSADGQRVELIDLTIDAGGALRLEQLNGSKVVTDLGLADTTTGDRIAGSRILSGLNTVFLRTLDGGQGVSDLGGVQLTSRSGATATVDLSGATTLSDVIRRINDSGIGVAARVNSSRTGLEIYDTSGSTAGDLTIADADTTTTATRLGITGSAAADRLRGTDLQRQVISEATRLSSLNGGAGVARGTFKIKDTLGVSATVDLSNTNISTVGDLINEIKRLGLAVDVRINDAGDGLLLADSSAAGIDPLEVTEGGGSTAADLNFLAKVEKITVAGREVDSINASTTRKITLDADDTLRDLVTKINDLKAGVSAGSFSTGSTVAPFRLTLSSLRAGTAGELTVDSAGLGIELNETLSAQDALLLVGPGEAEGAGLLVSSSSNTFNGAVGGVSVTLLAPSTDNVTVTLAQSSTDLKEALQGIVDNYNEIRAKIDELTAVDPDTGRGQILVGESSLLRVELDLTAAISGAFRGAGAFGSLAEIGLKLTETGELELDSERFDKVYTDNPVALERLFTSDSSGVVARLDSVIKGLADEDNAVLVNRLGSLTRTLEINQERIDQFNRRLESSRERLLNTFIRSEEAIAKLQASLGALSAIRPLTPL